MRHPAWNRLALSGNRFIVRSRRAEKCSWIDTLWLQCEQEFKQDINWLNGSAAHVASPICAALAVIIISDERRFVRASPRALQQQCVHHSTVDLIGGAGHHDKAILVPAGRRRGSKQPVPDGPGYHFSPGWQLSLLQHLFLITSNTFNE